VSAASFGTFGAAVTPAQYRAAAANYPGVVDAVVMAQREINPTSLQWMNVMRVTLLTNTPWNPTQSQNYISYLQNNSMYAPRFVIDTPLGVSTNVNAVIYCFNWANVTQAQADAIAAVQALFTQGPGYLGKDITKNDIYDAIKNSNKGIDYVDLNSPTSNLIVSNQPMDAPGVTLFNTGGSLSTVGTYMYAVSVTTSYGQIAPKNWTSVQLASGNTNRFEITWAPRQDALFYTVWGRGVNGQFGWLANPTNNFFSDTGSASPSGTVPTYSTTPIRYNVLGGVSIVPKFTTRNTRLG
jgi:hypothetical protein